MPILPEEVAGTTFSTIPGGGYDPNQVHAFLREVAADYRALMEKLVRVSEAVPSFDVGQEVNAVLEAAERSRKAVMQRTHDEAETIQRIAAEKALSLLIEGVEVEQIARDKAAEHWAQVAREAEEYALDMRAQTETACCLVIEETQVRTERLSASHHYLRQHLSEIEALVATMRKEASLSLNPPAEPALGSDDASD